MATDITDVKTKDLPMARESCGCGCGTGCGCGCGCCGNEATTANTDTRSSVEN